MIYNNQIMDDYSPKFISKGSTGSTKFDLYLKSRELKELSRVLEQVLLLPQEQRFEWVEENGELVSEAVDGFIQDSSSALDGISLDPETMELSKELVLSLRDTMDIIQGILFDRPKLTS